MTELEAFVEANYGRLVGLLVLRTGRLDLAEDLAQDALIVLVEKWDDVQELKSPWAWLVTVAVNRQISVWRRLRTAIAAEPELILRTKHNELPEYPAEALSMLDGLPSRQRKTVILRHYAGLSVAETAEALGVAEGTIKAATAAALSSLRNDLTDQPDRQSEHQSEHEEEVRSAVRPV